MTTAGMEGKMQENNNFRTVNFEFRGKPGMAVFLAGSFNGWDYSKDQLVDPDGSGIYRISVELRQGKHEYKFLVDGRWLADPTNPKQVPDGISAMNSVVDV
jgi:1,4-alpha-glucan branching enzyme